MGSITLWLQQLHVGDESHLGELFERCQPHLDGLARAKLSGTPGRTAGVQDVTQDVFLHVLKALRRGSFPSLSDRNHLFALLTLITAGRASNQRKSERAQRRGGGRVRSLDALGAAADDDAHGAELIADDGPAPERQAILNDLYRRYVEELPEDLRAFVQPFLAGRTQKEIAAERGVVERTVERKIELAREKWRRLAAQDGLSGDAP